jgi:hypothetical protein
MSLRESVHHVHFDQERSFDHSKKSLGACDLDVKNPELVSLLNVDKKLLDDKDWGRHLKDQCLCKLCNCGKHVCHLHPIKLGLTVPDSTYTRSTLDLNQTTVIRVTVRTSVYGCRQKPSTTPR